MRGEADRAVAGGFDNPVSWWNMSRMDTIGIMSRHNELGAAACRPFDADRDGTVMGEGGAFFLLEEMETAKERGAKVYAEVVGFGSGIDTGSVITPEASGEGLTIAIEGALKEAEIAPDDVAYVAAHGSGTLLGDTTEAAALRTVFGDSGSTPASSVKPATGHLCAGAGALNAAVAALAVHHGALPPTLNLEHPDPDCNGIDWIPNDPREAEVRQALALARGFEGQNVALAFRAV
jgi:3-oxoacyl-[acyl-carrier-protein] synthase II